MENSGHKEKILKITFVLDHIWETHKEDDANEIYIEL